MGERLLPVVGVALGVLCLVAADWPQWRGPERNGISQETGLLKEWPKGGPPLLWKLKNVGYGYSTPSVVGENLYLLSNPRVEAKNVVMDEEQVVALDARDGKVLWSTRIGKVGPNQMMQFPAARSTPTVESEVLYALGSDGDLAAIETATGKVRWTKNVRSEFGGNPGPWAYSESPLIDGDVLVCTPGGKEATLVALNKQTGETIWKCPVPGGDQAAYASAIAVEVGGIKQYVQLVQNGLVGVDAKSGKFLWRYDQTAKGSPANIPTPVAHDGMIYCAGARKGGALVRLKAENGQVTAKPVYFDSKLPTAIGGTIELSGNLYGTTAQALVCTDFATGKVKWSNRSVGTGSLCYADGCLYIHGENDEVALVEASAADYREKGRFKLSEHPKRLYGVMEKAWSYPVVANGRLYIRDLNLLWCFDVKQPKSVSR
jgi:outer membrane protein assembly factor BamB